MNRSLIDVHILQTLPPSNVNRDDTGSPKSAVYGGVRRARVSSQAWKRATRQAFHDHLDESELGERTKFVVEKIAMKITELSPHLENAPKLAEEVLAATGIKVTPAKKAKKSEEQEEQAATGYLLFLARRQIEGLAALAVEAGASSARIEKKAAKAVLQEGNSIDLALFGRMVADAPDLNVDACCQVAHAISVHGVQNEFDYFTAVDDNGSEDHAGAGMIGTVEFNSSTLYRYATIDVDELAKSLGSVEAAARAVDAFLTAFVTSMPTGKQNTFANRTRPDFVMVTIRDDQPVNLVGAFETPIESNDGRMLRAAQTLVEYAARQDDAYRTAPHAQYALAVGMADSDELSEALAQRAELVDLPSMIERTVATIGDRAAVPA
ncbi:type I-E CRISPR-associated protein Cas7/Cse4/CasC [Tomitella fengzijianii]|uniref:Type I-E CRISPR-associated protein Cas7/Cse4/CasC n=1 Tax=Tomitella fengzijianii TaxID=2597660 RepID=A0A516X664_9ACTN|nr:type I-E CRISPR-associated protein Cas7/Cse4/CasC [Tomitella fengzijianii]QDQ98567.1 type I-E CRISPR-associated protein Cas7/Cse4/CasC [Tomitella fengzijianii]